ncbi:MAG: hormogonium polysaccharide biosynthesis glycosyltransferase HpsE [Oculatellaceae cyanobacterium Prado106]|jgi:glycosyltransferase involved in cell wall biosynthesis|nr:hormogonium polysaccharide biosynthesis glycosyltransferase HpsE [Oculatellaceae cyanobacterium Prado106]
MTDFTVSIRTYNGEQRLPAVLDQLRSQANLQGIDWEIVIVDNNSSDRTAEVVQQYQANWQVDGKEICPLRYCFEGRQGAAIARRRLIEEAQGTFIGFLDDDNVPDLHWVATAYAFGLAHPQAGAFGGQIHGDFEVPPPRDFGKIAPYLAVIERKQTFCYNRDVDGTPARKVLPPGAGLVVRRQVWLDCVPEEQKLQGPIGNSLTAKGEDMEALLYISQAGWEIWNHAELHMMHQMPKWRFEREYLLRLCQGVGLGKYPLRMLGYMSWQKPFVVWFYWLNDGQKLIRLYLKTYAQLKTDVVAACELQVLKYSVVSPFYHWRGMLLEKVAKGGRGRSQQPQLKQTI